METKEILEKSKQTRDTDRRFIGDSEQWVQGELREIFPIEDFNNIENFVYFHDRLFTVLKSHSERNVLIYLMSLKKFKINSIAKTVGLSYSRTSKIIRKIKKDLKNSAK